MFVGGTVAAMNAAPSIRLVSNSPRTLRSGGGTNNIVFQLTDEKHMGFVAKINGDTGHFGLSSGLKPVQPSPSGHR